jgi:hypothetical protein
MEVLWTTVSYVVVASGALLAVYILVRWFASAWTEERHGH